MWCVVYTGVCSVYGCVWCVRVCLLQLLSVLLFDAVHVCVCGVLRVFPCVCVLQLSSALLLDVVHVCVFPCVCVCVAAVVGAAV